MRVVDRGRDVEKRRDVALEFKMDICEVTASARASSRERASRDAPNVP
jgi:hypothetical protein